MLTAWLLWEAEGREIEGHCYKRATTIVGIPAWCPRARGPPRSLGRPRGMLQGRGSHGHLHRSTPAPAPSSLPALAPCLGPEPGLSSGLTCWLLSQPLCWGCAGDGHEQNTTCSGSPWPRYTQGVSTCFNEPEMGRHQNGAAGTDIAPPSTSTIAAGNGCALLPIPGHPCAVPALLHPRQGGGWREVAAPVPAQGSALLSSASSPQRPACFLAWIMCFLPPFPEDEE